MGSGKESTIFSTDVVMAECGGGGRIDGDVRVRGLVFRELVPTEVSILKISPS